MSLRDPKQLDFLFGPPVSKLLQIVMHGSKNRFMLKRKWRKKNFYKSDVSIKYIFLHAGTYLRIRCEFSRAKINLHFGNKICKFMFYLFKRASVCKWYDMGKCWWKQDRIKTGQGVFYRSENKAGGKHLDKGGQILKILIS